MPIPGRTVWGEAEHVVEKWALTALITEAALPELCSSKSKQDYQAVSAAGNWGLDAAWPAIVALLNYADTPKPLLLAAIGAAASIRPQEAGEILIDLAASDDEEIAEAADEAIAMSEPTADEDDDENDASGGSIERHHAVWSVLPTNTPASRRDLKDCVGHFSLLTGRNMLWHA